MNANDIKMKRKDCPILEVGEDKLNVLPYIDGLVKFIKKCDTPMTISLQGEWGSGKTSFMNLILSKLNENNTEEEKIDYITVNVWEYAQLYEGSDIAKAVLGGMLSQLIPKSKAEAAFKSIMKGLGLFVLGAAEIAGSQNVATSLVGKIDKKNNIPTTQQLKKEIKEGIDKKDRVVVFIDDLDRLKPIEAVEVLETVKNFLDFENIIHVLAIDYNVIVNGVKEKYGNEFKEEKAHQYFEKIIQVPFKIPTQSYDMDSYIESLCMVKSDDLKDIKSIVKSSIGNNPRAIKRVMNILELTKLINSSKNSERLGITDKDLLVVICLQFCSNDIYDEMVKKPENWMETINRETEYNINNDFKNIFINLFEEDINKLKLLLELTKVTDYSNNAMFDTNKTYYVKIIVGDTDHILMFKHGNQLGKGIPALNYLIINTHLRTEYTKTLEECKDIIKESKGLKTQNPFIVFDYNGKVYEIMGKDLAVLNEITNIWHLENVICLSENDAELSQGIIIDEKLWTAYSEKSKRGNRTS